MTIKGRLWLCYQTRILLFGRFFVIASFGARQSVAIQNKRSEVSLENKRYRSPLGDVSLEKPNPFEKVDSRLSGYEALKQAEML